MPIIGIYLAAGTSRRMGRNKFALAVGKMTLRSLALDTAVQSSLDTICIITNEEVDLTWLPVRLKMHEECKVVKCRDANEGQSASLRCGIEYAIEAGASAIVILLADQPFITIGMIDEMMECWKLHPNSKYIATTHEGTMKPSILFTEELFPALLKIRGDQGAKKILRGEFLEHGNQMPCASKRVTGHAIGIYFSLSSTICP